MEPLRSSKQTTPVSNAVFLTDLTIDTVEIVDPTHPLYDKKLPLVGFSTKQHLGRVAIVWLYPGVERCVPVSATDLAQTPLAPPSQSRLSVDSLERPMASLIAPPFPNDDALVLRVCSLCSCTFLSVLFVASCAGSANS